VYIRLLVFWWVKVHNTVDTIDVNTPCRDIGTDENLESL